ncbi:MAG: hypothetical protein JWO31_3964, partial [Phycisphaerales bacterium]|nr:hypothetical protein [Phycisphaerales bacterium]
MRKWTKAAGVIFLAASSVYPDGVVRAASADRAKPAKGPVEVKPLEDAPAPVLAPATRPAAVLVSAVPAAPAV